MCEVSEDIKFAPKTSSKSSSWKPIQTGLQLTTRSLLALHTDLVVESKRLAFLLPGLISQDALENVFSQVKNKGVSHPRASKFRTALKLVCLSQLLYIRKGSCYEEDDTPHLLEFINQPGSDDPEPPIADPVIIDEALAFLGNECEMNGFYYICGWAVKKVLKKLTCSFCTQVLTNLDSDHLVFSNISMLTLIKWFVKNPMQFDVCDATFYLCHPSSVVLDFLKHVEIAFRSNIAQAVYARDPTSFIKRAVASEIPTRPICHTDIIDKVEDYYLKLRFFICEKGVASRLRAGRQFASKSAAKRGIA